MTLDTLNTVKNKITSQMKELRLRQSKSTEKFTKVDYHSGSGNESNYVIYDSTTDSTYLRGRLLGKGGFARCYELTDLKTNRVYAGKIIAKNRIAKPHQRQKILREVDLHKDLKHKHVVEFHSYFEDEENVYIILENCCRKSLVHVLKQRKTLTEPEVRYYIKHLVEASIYTHGRNIIHRDLKLGNMLLNESMQLKIADFGLATRVEYDGEKKMTVCGTPNYIAPEVLQKRGHSYEADIWAIGCVMYALLVGRPPFETSSLKETYVRITANLFFLPPDLSTTAKALIRRCLTQDPTMRPSLNEILADPFLTTGHMPKTLSSACCTSVPKFSSTSCTISISRPSPPQLSHVTHKDHVRKMSASLNQMTVSTKPLARLSQINDLNQQKAIVKSPSQGELIQPDYNLDGDQNNSDKSPSNVCDTEINEDRSSSTHQTLDKSLRPRSAAVLLDVLTTCLDHMPRDADTNPKSSNEIQFLWITKWVDYSNKYGFGYQLSNNAIGVLFNDTSRITLGPDGRAVQYYDVNGKLSAYTNDCVPTDLAKKTTLLTYFSQYMDEHLIQGGNMDAEAETNEMWSGGLYLKKWFRTSKAIFLYLSDGSLQVNFFDDHTKIILSYHNNDYVVTYIDSDRRANVYSMVNLIQDGCKPDIIERMTFAKFMLQNLVDIEGEDV